MLATAIKKFVRVKIFGNGNKSSRVHQEKLIVTQLVKKLPAFHGTWRFITVFTRARRWSLFWVRYIQSTHSHRFPKIISNIILSTPKSYEWSLTFRLSDQNSLCILHVPHACPSHLILLNLITLILGKVSKLWSVLAPCSQSVFLP